MKIIHFADVHLGIENYGKIDPQTGLNLRLHDFEQSLNFIGKYAIDHKIDLVLFAGDAYKNREPTPTHQRIFAQFLATLSHHNIPTVMVIGNHDFPNAPGKANTLDVFSALKIPNVYVSQKPEILSLKTRAGEVQVITLPWLSKIQLLGEEIIKTKNSGQINQLASAKISEIITDKIADIRPNIPAILLGHISVEGALYGSEQAILPGWEAALPIKVLSSKKLDYVALGHLHRHQVPCDNPPVIYSGSIERIDFGEEKEEKGFIEVRMSNVKCQMSNVTWQFIKLPAREFLTIKTSISHDDTNPTEKIIQKIKEVNIKDKVVKIVIDLPKEKLGEILENPIREALGKAFFIAGINREIKGEIQEQTIKGYSDTLASFTPLQMFEKYLQEKKVPKSRLVILMEHARKLIEELEG